jgi:hypothetical protein
METHIELGFHCRFPGVVSAELNRGRYRVLADDGTEVTVSGHDLLDVKAAAYVDLISPQDTLFAVTSSILYNSEPT